MIQRNRKTGSSGNFRSHGSTHKEGYNRNKLTRGVLGAIMGGILTCLTLAIAWSSNFRQGTVGEHRRLTVTGSEINKIQMGRVSLSSSWLDGFFGEKCNIATKLKDALKNKQEVTGEADLSQIDKDIYVDDDENKGDRMELQTIMDQMPSSKLNPLGEYVCYGDIWDIVRNTLVEYENLQHRQNQLNKFKQEDADMLLAIIEAVLKDTSWRPVTEEDKGRISDMFTFYKLRRKASLDLLCPPNEEGYDKKRFVFMIVDILGTPALNRKHNENLAENFREQYIRSAAKDPESNGSWDTLDAYTPNLTRKCFLDIVAPEQRSDMVKLFFDKIAKENLSVELFLQSTAAYFLYKRCEMLNLKEKGIEGPDKTLAVANDLQHIALNNLDTDATTEIIKKLRNDKISKQLIKASTPAYNKQILLTKRYRMLMEDNIKRGNAYTAEKFEKGRNIYRTDPNPRMPAKEGAPEFFKALTGWSHELYERMFE